MADKQIAIATKSASLAARLLLLLIAIYRNAISPFIPSRCRYFPTCSSYAEEAIRRYGFVRGGHLAVKRLFRCHPWGSHGYDPVPDLPNHSTHCCQRKP